MKKKASVLLIALFIMTLIFLLSGCAQDKQQAESPSNKITIYTTLFPLFDFARQIGGEHVEVYSVIPTGAESHDFEPSAKDIIAINQADMFIYNGAGYETWIENVIDNLDASKTMLVDASSELKIAEILGASHSHDHEEGHEEGHKEEHDHVHDDANDPHTWLDPINAKTQAGTILASLTALDPTHEADYQANYDRFATELDSLDLQYKEMIKHATKHEIVVSHQAFGYLANRYGFKQVPIAGLSPSSEPSTKALQQLIELIKEHELKYVAFDALVESKVAKTVQRETGAESVTLYTIENVTKQQMEQDVTYLQLMKENLETLKKVLEVQ